MNSPSTPPLEFQPTAAARPWYRKKRILIPAALLAFIVVTNGSDDTVSSPNTDLTATSRDAEPKRSVSKKSSAASNKHMTAKSSTATKRKAARKNSKKPRTVSTPAKKVVSRSAASVDAYLAAVAPTAIHMSEKLGLIGQAATMTGNGELTFDQYAQLADAFVIQVQNVKSVVRNAEPPAALQDTHDYYVQALDTFERAGSLSADGARTMDIDSITEASLLMEEGTRLIELASVGLTN